MICYIIIVILKCNFHSITDFSMINVAIALVIAYICAN